MAMTSGVDDELAELVLFNLVRLVDSQLLNLAVIKEIAIKPLLSMEHSFLVFFS